MPESVGFLQISLMVMVSHCSQHSLQQSTVIRAKFEVQSCLSPIGSVAKAMVCNASDPALEQEIFFFPEFPFPVKINFKSCGLSTICTCAWSNWPKGSTHVYIHIYIHTYTYLSTKNVLFSGHFHAKSGILRDKSLFSDVARIKYILTLI